MSNSIHTLIRKIDTEMDDQKIQVNALPFWPYLRQVIYSHLIFKAQKGHHRFFKDTVKQLFSSLYGLHHWFKSYDVLFFSDATLRKNMDGHYFDRSFDSVIQQLDSKKCLIIEKLTEPTMYHFPLKKVATPHIASYSYFLLKALRFGLSKINIDGRETLERILNDCGLSQLNYAYLAKNFYIQYKQAQRLLSKQSPKAIFVNCYYGKVPIIIAAKERGIPVIEIQHGLINPFDTAYFNVKNQDTQCYPDWFWCFGEKEKHFFKTASSSTIPPQNVRVVGGYLIDYYQKKFHPDTDLSERLKFSKFSICVSGQGGGLEPRMLSFLAEVCMKNPHFFIVYVPRTPKIFHTDISLPSNLYVCKDLSIYAVMMQCQYHSTVYSTCAIEAAAFSKPNILINFDGLSHTFLGHHFEKSDPSVSYVQTPTAFSEACQNFAKTSSFKEFSDWHFKRNYPQNIKSALSSLSIL